MKGKGMKMDEKRNEDGREGGRSWKRKMRIEVPSMPSI